MTQAILSIQNLKKFFPTKSGLLKAIDDISIDIHAGEVLGLVGESGCGKSTLGKILMKLEQPTEGKVLFEGNDITEISQSSLRAHRKNIQMIFQDPYASLNPRMTVSDIIAEPIDIHRLYQGAQREGKIDELLDTVGIDVSFKNRFPHELSGGQRQRIGIARALALSPKFLVCDEPISALDVSVQAQIINLLKKLQKDFGVTIIFIAHDLGVVKYLSTKVAVMYLGRIVEVAPADELYDSPKHPYTQALISAIPIPDPKMERSRDKLIIKGEIPSPVNPPVGCAFATRCPKAQSSCFHKRPALESISDAHKVACHLLSV
ncbi:MAG: ATP-binding cassette domain-containing protein [Chlamydiae bacterium]|nr:ATP-binding cassette domain-containing protein [Chlamydiota bacterium]